MGASWTTGRPSACALGYISTRLAPEPRGSRLASDGQAALRTLQMTPPAGLGAWTETSSSLFAEYATLNHACNLAIRTGTSARWCASRSCSVLIRCRTARRQGRFGPLDPGVPMPNEFTEREIPMLVQVLSGLLLRGRLSTDGAALRLRNGLMIVAGRCQIASLAIPAESEPSDLTMIRCSCPSQASRSSIATHAVAFRP